MGFRYIVNLFKKHSVCVVGMKGSGKDLLMANVVCRRNKPYVSNMDYCARAERFPLDMSALDCGGNTYNNFISGDIKPYVWPYPENTEVYISDVGVYFPSQYCGELNRDYKYFPIFLALSRHVGGHDCKVHCNCQNLNRVWDKIREMSDVYLLCRWSRVLFGFLVIQKVTEYDKHDSCVARINPCRVHTPLFGNKVAKMQAETYIDGFYNAHGRVRNHILIYFNKSRYDSYIFKSKLKRGVDD